MNTALKKIISGITTLSICAAMIGIMPAIADDNSSTGGISAQEDSTSAKRPLTVEFMGVGNTPAATGKLSGNLSAENVYSPTDTTNRDKTKFWISLGVERVNDLPLFTQGVYSLEIAFEYDPDFIRPDVGGGTDSEKEGRWNSDIVAANTASGKDWENYFVESVIETDLDTDPDSDRANKDKLTERANWKMCTVCLTVNKEAVTTRRFTGLDTADKQYLLAIPFTLVSVPGENDPDQNPIVLSLVRGPETFDIGSGTDGKSPNAKWNETQNQNAENNLSTYFEFKGDIQLFGSKQTITDIIPFRNIPQKDENGDPIKDTDDNILTTKETYELSTDTNLNGGEFNPDVDTYYLSITNQPNNLQLEIQSSEQPTVTVNGNTVEVSLVDGNYVTDAFELDELEQNSDGTYKSDEFRNTIEVSAGGTTYTIYVRRLLQPRIELMPGNSPYGLIERMSKKYKGDAGWTDDEIQEAKDAFDNSDSVFKKYGKDYLPKSGEKDLFYTTEAWRSYTKHKTEIIDVEDTGTQTEPEIPEDLKESVNYDMDSNAIFIYQADQFTLPSVKFYNEFGVEMTDINKMDVSFKVKEQKAGACKYDGKTDKENGVTEIDAPLVEGTTDTYTLVNNIIRNDVYFINYVYHYTDASNHNRKIKFSRPAIILSKRGDVRLDPKPTISNADAQYLSANAGALHIGNSLIAYRIADLKKDSKPTINNSDAQYLRANAGALHIGQTQYYKTLDKLQ